MGKSHIQSQQVNLAQIILQILFRGSHEHPGDAVAPEGQGIRRSWQIPAILPKETHYTREISLQRSSWRRIMETAPIPWITRTCFIRSMLSTRPWQTAPDVNCTRIFTRCSLQSPTGEDHAGGGEITGGEGGIKLGKRAFTNEGEDSRVKHGW